MYAEIRKIAYYDENTKKELKPLIIHNFEMMLLGMHYNHPFLYKF